MDSHIDITPGVVGGQLIAGHRISVQDIVVWHERMGKCADEIAAEYNLTLADVYAALAYYFDRREEIGRVMHEADEAVEAMRKQTPSLLRQKLKGDVWRQSSSTWMNTSLTPSPAVCAGGVDVLSVVDAEMSAPPMKSIARAKSEGRVIFGQDKDLFHLAAAIADHAGVVYADMQTPIGAIINGLMLIHGVMEPGRDDRVSGVSLAGHNFNAGRSPTLSRSRGPGQAANLELQARLIVEGYLSGMHKSPYHGFSVEFAQHREYVRRRPKHLDWKVFSRTGRFYLKQYEQETNLACWLLVDASDRCATAPARAARRPTPRRQVRLCGDGGGGVDVHGAAAAGFGRPGDVRRSGSPLLKPSSQPSFLKQVVNILNRGDGS